MQPTTVIPLEIHSHNKMRFLNSSNSNLRPTRKVSSQTLMEHCSIINNSNSKVLCLSNVLKIHSQLTSVRVSIKEVVIRIRVEASTTNSNNHSNNSSSNNLDSSVQTSNNQTNKINSSIWAATVDSSNQIRINSRLSNRTIINSQEDSTTTIIITTTTNSIMATNKIVIKQSKKIHLLTSSTEM